MIHRRLLDYDADLRVKVEHEHDAATGKSRFLTTQDVEPILESNKQRQTSGYDGYMDREKAFRHAAHIPDVVWMKWKIEEGIDIFNKDHLPAIKRKLDDPEWRHLRTDTFRLGTGDR